MQQATHETKMFTLDGLSNWFFGYQIEGNYWNGWSNPVFEQENMVKVAEEINALNNEMLTPEDDNYVQIRWDGDTMILTENTWDGEKLTERIEPHTITVNGEERKVYALKHWDWCWMESVIGY